MFINVKKAEDSRAMVQTTVVVGGWIPDVFYHFGITRCTLLQLIRDKGWRIR